MPSIQGDRIAYADSRPDPDLAGVRPTVVIPIGTDEEIDGAVAIQVAGGADERAKILIVDGAHELLDPHAPRAGSQCDRTGVGTLPEHQECRFFTT